MSLPFSQACENNKQPIFNVLQQYIDEQAAQLLEVGAGTGQHAVYFAKRFPQLIWQAVDIDTQVLTARFAQADLENLLAPKNYQAGLAHSLLNNFNYVFTANTLHIMSSCDVAAFCSDLQQITSSKSRLFIYGPFKYNGNYTSDSNQNFDAWLKARDPASGIKDFEWLCKHLSSFKLLANVSMPANNQCLVFQKNF